ncbi:MAG: hypothetical protein ACLQO6_20345 [Desulfomonilaceae bacterium]
MPDQLTPELLHQQLLDSGGNIRNFSLTFPHVTLCSGLYYLIAHLICSSASPALEVAGTTRNLELAGELTAEPSRPFLYKLGV